MKLTGYCDPWVASTGDTIGFKVSSKVGDYRSEIVQLIHGDKNPRGPGLKTRKIADLGITKAFGEQAIQPGSFIEFPHHTMIDRLDNFSVTLWVYPTLSKETTQCLIGQWDNYAEQGWSLSFDSSGSIAFQCTTTDGIVLVDCESPLSLNVWCFVALRVNTTEQTISLLTQPLREWLPDSGCTWASARMPGEIIRAKVPLTIGAWHDSRIVGSAKGAHFNGKIENPSLFNESLSDELIATIIDAGVKENLPSLFASWDFSRNFATQDVQDIGPNQIHGVTHQSPARAMTGHLWDGNHINFADAPEQYAAIKFHEDDLTDANWQSDFEFTIPNDLTSGYYAARIYNEQAEDYIPFFVSPKIGRSNAEATIAVLAPTMSYLAYANDRLLEGPPAVFTNQDLSINKEAYEYCFANELKSTYDRHPDGSGVMYSSSRRPLVNMRPGFHHAALGCPHQLPADLHLVDWLHEKSMPHDVITDVHLHRHQHAALEQYKVIITGTHPEYWSREMLDAMQAFLDHGGRLMYLGGNGFYWVTSFFPESDHIMEIRRAFGTRAWESEPGELYHGASGERGGLWRWRGRAPQKMTGVGFTAQGFDNGSAYNRKDDSYSPQAAYIFEGVDSDIIGDSPSLVMNSGAAGFELDRYDEGQGTPPHTLWLATSTNHSNSYQAAVEDIFMSNSMQGGPVSPNVRADMTLLTYPQGGAVFSSGSIAWCGSLSENKYNNDVSRITENVLRRFLSNDVLS